MSPTVRLEPLLIRQLSKPPAGPSARLPVAPTQVFPAMVSEDLLQSDQEGGAAAAAPLPPVGQIQLDANKL